MSDNLNYVLLSYGLTYVVLIAYTLRVFRKQREAQQLLDKEIR